MEGTLAEIRLFGGTFAPRGWMFCAGQSLAISAYDAVFALLGTTYGGDGVNTFNLPDLRSRIAVGTGQGLGLSSYTLGQMGGTEGVTLLTSNIPSHTHTATLQAGTPTVTATISLNGAASGAGGSTTPGGNLLGSDGSSNIYNNDTAATTVAMATGSIPFSGTTLTAAPVSSGIAGQSLPHNNIQPYGTANYIICVEGIFPSRN